VAVAHWRRRRRDTAGIPPAAIGQAAGLTFTQWRRYGRFPAMGSGGTGWSRRGCSRWGRFAQGMLPTGESAPGRTGRRHAACLGPAAALGGRRCGLPVAAHRGRARRGLRVPLYRVGRRAWRA
jgi:hypothetical protein